MQVSTTKFKNWQKQDPQSQTGNPAYEKAVRQQNVKINRKCRYEINRPINKVGNGNENDNNHKLRHLYKCIDPKPKQTNNKQTRKGTFAESQQCPFNPKTS